ncbi:MAG: LptF/LptG family permease [Desulfurobacteriaceae bacterium]
MVKILDRYIFTETLKYFSLTLLVFLVLFFMIDFVSNIELGTKQGIMYVLYRIPLYLVRLIPIAVLISVITVLSNLSASRELTVIKALGISIYRVSVPILIFSALISLCSFSVNELVVPKTTYLSKEIKYKVKKKKNLKLLGNSIWFKNESNTFVFIGKLNPSSFIAEKISIFFLNKEFIPSKRIDAMYAKYIENGIWKLEKGFERELTKFETKSFKERKIKLGIDKKDLILKRIESDTINAFSLYKIIKQMERIGYDARNYLVDFYTKFSIPLLPIIVALIGIPLGVYNPRNRKGYTLWVAVGLTVLMWIIISFFINLGKSGVLPPIYAAFAPQVMFLAVGLWLLARTDT